MRAKPVVLSAAAAAVIGVLAGCGSFNESNGYNLPPASHTYRGAIVTRISTPQFYPTIMRICLPHQVGLYENPDATQGVWVLHPDPNCPASQR